MKKLILFLLLLPALAWGGEPIEIARMNPYILGAGVAATCNPADNEVGDRTQHPTDSLTSTNNIVCMLYEADCSGTLGAVYVYHNNKDMDNIKVGVFDSVYQTDLTSEHKPDSSDTAVSGSSWVTVSCNTNGGWCNSGETKVGGSVTSGTKYLVCWIGDDSTNFMMKRDVTSGNYAYANTSGSYASPPASLDGSWNSYTPRAYSIYVAIE